MTDRYQQFATSSLGKLVVNRLGLPSPVRLRRYHPGQPLLGGPALVGAAADGRLIQPVSDALTKADAEVRTADTEPDQRYGALVFDATGITDPAQLGELHEFFHPV